MDKQHTGLRPILDRVDFLHEQAHILGRIFVLPRCCARQGVEHDRRGATPPARVEAFQVLAQAV